MTLVVLTVLARAGDAEVGQRLLHSADAGPDVQLCPVAHRRHAAALAHSARHQRRRADPRHPRRRRRLGLFASATTPTSCSSRCPRRPRSCATPCACAAARTDTPWARCRRPPRSSSRRPTKPARRARAARGVQRVVIEKPRFDIRDHLWSGTVGLASLIGQIVVVTFLTYFLLLSGDTFRRKLVKITGPRLRRQEDHRAGAGRDHRADPALPAGAAADQRRWSGWPPGWPSGPWGWSTRRCGALPPAS